MMVVGRGLLAKAFSLYNDNPEVLIFASGVSNSKETNKQAFLREFDLLKSFRHTRAKLIYFSTTSVLDTSLSQSMYVRHKLQMESYIKNHVENYLIFRLPNVVGQSTNPNTFFNNVKSALKKGSVIVVKDAYRRLIDVDDLITYVPSIINCENRRTVDVGFSNQASVLELIQLMASIMGVQYVQHLQDGGSSCDIDNKCFLSYLDPNCVGLSQDYNYTILKKYLKNDDHILPT